MSETKTYTFPWFVVFVVGKFVYPPLFAWSWWWVFLPIIPVLVEAFNYIGGNNG